MKPQLLVAFIVLCSFKADKTEMQAYKTNAATSTMVIAGTSTLHDWEMKAVNLTGDLDIEVYDQSLKINDLKLTVPVEALRSGKAAMDNNAYKALKKDEHPNIVYHLVSVSEIEKLASDEYKMLSRGKLTVAGKSRILNVPIKVKVLKDGVACSGSCSFNMSSFDVEPPSFMMGAVTTGDKITITFTINYN